MDFRLIDKVAIVTGAGSPRGFGRAICRTLAQEGCDIIAADIDQEGAQITAKDMESLGRQSIAVKVDITREVEVKEMLIQALERFEKIDILVNNAGAEFGNKAFEEQDEELWDKELALNLKGTMFCCKAVIPYMHERKYGKIVNISSATVKMVIPSISMYTIAKGGIFVFTRSLAKMLISQGINVNCIAPGWSTTTNFIKPKSGTTKEEIKASFLLETPINRGTEPEDVANIVAFLASDISSDIVGQVISVDGGLTMQ